MKELICNEPVEQLPLPDRPCGLKATYVLKYMWAGRHREHAVCGCHISSVIGWLIYSNISYRVEKDGEPHVYEGRITRYVIFEDENVKPKRDRGKQSLR